MATKKKKKSTKKKTAGKKITKKKVIRKISKKRSVKKPLKKKTAKKPLKRTKKALVTKKPKERILGIVTHYFPKVMAAVVKLKAPLAIDDAVKIKGHTTDLTQKVTSLQIDRVPITAAKKGQEIGLLVESRVRKGDKVYKA